MGTLLLALASLVAAGTSGREPLKEACVHGRDSQACAQLAALLEKDPTARRFDEEPGLYEQLACERGKSSECQHAAVWARRYDDYEDFESDVGCMLLDNAFACEEVAEALHDEAPGPDAVARATLRAKRALELYLDGCRRNDGSSCLGASRVYAKGYGLKTASRTHGCSRRRRARLA